MLPLHMSRRELGFWSGDIDILVKTESSHLSLERHSSFVEKGPGNVIKANGKLGA